MNPFNRQLRPATAAECRAPWGGFKSGLRFRCGLCGHRFKPGDQWRGVMANAGGPARCGNFLVCAACHHKHGGEDASLLEERAAQEKEAHERFWWLMEEEALERYEGLK